MNGCVPFRIPDGGWGESCASYDKRHLYSYREHAPLADRLGVDAGLMAGGDTLPVQASYRASEYLIETQSGRWHLAGS